MTHVLAAQARITATTKIAIPALTFTRRDLT
jgi:hypothetical protein